VAPAAKQSLSGLANRKRHGLGVVDSMIGATKPESHYNSSRQPKSTASVAEAVRAAATPISARAKPPSIWIASRLSGSIVRSSRGGHGAEADRSAVHVADTVEQWMVDFERPARKAWALPRAITPPRNVRAWSISIQASACQKPIERAASPMALKRPLPPYYVKRFGGR
jgi:hypothetical protein